MYLNLFHIFDVDYQGWIIIKCFLGVGNNEAGPDQTRYNLYLHYSASNTEIINLNWSLLQRSILETPWNYENNNKFVSSYEDAPKFLIIKKYIRVL